LCVFFTSAVATNAKATSLDTRVKYVKNQIKYDKLVLRKYRIRLHKHTKKLVQLKELQRIYALSPVGAILYIFGSHSQEAINVAACESGGGDPKNISIYAQNGQYLGMFQMGTNERATYAKIGYDTPYQQTVAAWNYFAVSGWSPWDCQP
jgi:hypothetical protein